MKRSRQLRSISRSIRSLLLALSAAAAPAFVATAASDTYPEGEQASESVRPKFSKVLRQNEDWSSFIPSQANGTGIDATLDPLKHIALSDNGHVWLSIGGAARARQEYFGNFGFNASNDDEFLLTRVRLHGDLHIGEQVRVFVEGKSAFSTERNLPGGRRTIDVDELALQQAFVDFKFDIGENSDLTVRGGRQMLSFGKNRLVSPLPWANALRAWDGVSLIANHGGWKTHAFWTQFAPVQKFDFNNSDRQTQFFGAYATGPLNKDLGLNADFYFLGLDQSDITNTFNGTTGAERRYTVGTRLFGKLMEGAIDYDFEAAYQFGDLGAGDINAYMIAAELGYKFGGDWSPRLFVGLDYASGDESAGGDVETFNHLFPLGHKYLGFIDVVGRQNIFAVNAGATVKPTKKLGLRLAGHLFWRADSADALYNAGGGVVRAGNLSNDRYVGAEIDLSGSYQIDRHTTFNFGYSHFFAGDFIDSATPAASEDIDFIYAQLHFVF